MKNKNIRLALATTPDSNQEASSANRNKLLFSAGFEESGHIPAGMNPVFCETGLSLFQNSQGSIYWNSQPSTNAYPLLRAFSNELSAAGSAVSLPSLTGAVRCGNYVVLHSSNTLHLVLSDTNNSSEPPRYLGTLQELAAPPRLTLRAGAVAIAPYQVSPVSAAVIELDIDTPSGKEEVTAAYIRGDSQERKISSSVLQNIYSIVNDALREYDTALACSGFFSTPFYISAAWRLPDGSHTAPSAPQLIIPCSGGLMAVVSSCVANEKSIHLKLSLLHKVCSMFFRLEGSIPAWLESIGVSHLDFFITSPCQVELNDSVKLLTVTPDIYSVSGEPLSSGNGLYTFENYGEHRPSGQLSTVRCFRRQQLSAEAIERQLLARDKMFLIASVPTSELTTTTGFRILNTAVATSESLTESLKNCEVFIPDYTLCNTLTARSLWNCDGAVWLADPKYTESVPTQSASVVTKVPEGNLIYSQPGNPFSLSLKNCIAAGTGSVIAISPSCRAVSSSSYTRYPLYAFTTDGIWAISMTDGVFRVSQRVSAHKCIAAPTRNGGIGLLPTGAVFHTLRGLAVLNGTTVTELEPDRNIPEALTGFPLMTDEHTGLIMTNAAVYSPAHARWLVASGREGITGYFYDRNGNITGYTPNGRTHRLFLNITDNSKSLNESASAPSATPDNVIYEGIFDSLTPVRLRSVDICGGSNVTDLVVSVSDDGRQWSVIARSSGARCASLSGKCLRLIRISVSSSTPCHARLSVENPPPPH